MTQARAGWRVGEWGFLGWAETVLKSAGAGVGIAAGLTALGADGDGPGGLRLAQVVLLAVLTVGLMAGVADRVLEREVVGMVFIPLLLAGHLGMTVALARDPGVYGPLVAFCVLVLAGDLIKLLFLATSDFRVRDLPRGAVLGLTGLYAVGYAALLVMQALP